MSIKTLLILSALILNSEQLSLKQVLILSRHNVRTPLSKTLSQTSPKTWPKWNENPGYLTPKGFLLEGFMGMYFSEWLHDEKLLLQGCPTQKEFFVYANTAQRTLASARAFVDGAFPSCGTTIHHANKVDPIFNPIIHNTTADYITEAKTIMDRKIKNLHLDQPFKHLEEILDYQHSDNCLIDHNCDLLTDKNTAYVKTGFKPNINGPLKIGKSAIDSFIMEYYEGLDTKQVAWGLLDTEEKWKKILDISYNYHNIIFNSTLLAKDISEPLIKYMSYILNKDIKVALLMGHDANIFTTLNAMGFKPYILKKQNEFIPVGGKILFQKWSNNNTNEFLKIDYVYQSSQDMRDGIKLNLEAPPMVQKLELNGCKRQDNGLCFWADFIDLLKELITK